MDIEYDLLPKQKRRKQGLKVSIDLYPTATELYENLDTIGIVKRVQEIQQLGLIKVNSNLIKSRYDYILLQLYFHKIIKKNIQGCLRYTYNNFVKKKEFLAECSEIRDDVSIADIIQCLTIAYNVGHFYNTFTASRAVIMLAAEDDTFLSKIKSSCSSPRFIALCDDIISKKDYRRMHLLNTLIILDHCDSSLESVKLTKEIIYAYLDEPRLPQDSKLHFVFNLFRMVRNNAYIAYDLQIANTPFTLDLWNEKAVLSFFEELLSEFNNGRSASELVRSIQKLLDSTVYNENSNAICYYQISRKMHRAMINDYSGTWGDYYQEYFLNKSSRFNSVYSQRRDYDQDGILKITFGEDHRLLAEDLIDSLEHTDNIRTGYYDRYSNDTTVLIALKNSCKDKSKTAFKVLKLVVSYLRRMELEPCDDRYILTTKFFLRHLFVERNVIIKPTINEKKCVFCTRGKSRRIEELQMILEESIGNIDEEHEVQAIIDRIQTDQKNDTCITVPGSTLVFSSNGQKLCEIDGIVIYPQRKDKQIIMLEAKNTDEKPGYGAKCLAKKMKKLGWKYDRKQILVTEHDASYNFSVGEEVAKNV